MKQHNEDENAYMAIYAAFFMGFMLGIMICGIAWYIFTYMK